MGKGVVSGGVRFAPCRASAFGSHSLRPNAGQGALRRLNDTALPPAGSEYPPPSRPSQALERISEMVSKQTYQYPRLNRPGCVHAGDYPWAVRSRDARNHVAKP